jgi:ubiquinone/menaquinone biosynthesis C-methylase UbiE
MSDFIKNFWENQAVAFKGSHSASWGDNFAIDLEIGCISKYIKEGNSVLDVGCSNGHATLAMLQKKPSGIPRTFLLVLAILEKCNLMIILLMLFILQEC